MPELPEVEITRRGLEPFLTQAPIMGIEVRNPRLRWPIPPNLAKLVKGRQIHSVSRRGKYLLLDCSNKSSGGWLILHLGMSGSLRILPRTGAGTVAPTPHDHFDLLLPHHLMRLRDPRRFGAVLWTDDAIDAHPLLAELGVEPLTEAFNPEMLYAATRGRSAPIKQVLMNSHIVVGVGNIYANESLFRAGIRPGTPAGRLSRARLQKLVPAVKEVLGIAIAAGGSSLRDFVQSDGSSGYMQQQYYVYGRDNEPCRVCKTMLKVMRMGQRSTFYCSQCQT